MKTARNYKCSGCGRTGAASTKRYSAAPFRRQPNGRLVCACGAYNPKWTNRSDPELRNAPVVSDPGYHGQSLYNATQRVDLIKRTVVHLRVLRKVVEFDSVVFRGLSGAVIAISAADALGLHVVAVRKKNDGSHSSQDVEHPKVAKRAVVVDDFIASGKTMREIAQTVADGTDIKLVACYLYGRADKRDHNSIAKRLGWYTMSPDGEIWHP